MRTKTWSLLASWVQPLSVLSSCCSWGSRLASSVGSGSRSWAGKGMNWGQRGSGSSTEPPCWAVLPLAVSQPHSWLLAHTSPPSDGICAPQRHLP